MSNQNDNIQIDEDLWQEIPDKADPLEVEINEVEKNYKTSLIREAKLLTAKAGANQVSRGYYVQLKKSLEDLLMLELAQKAVEAQMKYETYKGVIEITDSGLTSFKDELEKIKKLKLIKSILPLASIPEEQNNVITQVIHDLYGKEGSMPEIKEKQSEYITVTKLKELLTDYADKINNNINKNIKRRD